MLLHLDTIHEGGRYRIKDREKARIFQSICLKDFNTRKAIARQLKLRPTTVCGAIQELIQDKLVLEGQARNPGKQGRPEICLIPNYSRLAAIALYVISREIKGALLNLGEKIVAEHSLVIPKEADNSLIISRVKRILDFLTRALPSGAELIGIGASLPGTVDQKSCKWISSARWPRLKDLKFTEIERAVGLPVKLSRSLDTELEFLLLKNPEYRQGGTLLFHWGYGIGSAYARQGAVLRSSLGRFGEVGHIQVSLNSSKLCNCGFYGCLETEAALWSLLPEIRETFPEAPEDESEFTGFMHKRDISSLSAISRALGFINLGLANLYKIFYPDRILLLGPFTVSGSVFDGLVRSFSQALPDYARRSVKLKRIDGFQGQILGGLYPMFRQALKSFLTVRSSA